MRYLELLPHDRAFTTRRALDLGVTRHSLKGLVEAGFVRPLFKGLLVRSDVELTVGRRAQAVSLVLPKDAVATDETSSWIHGVDVYPRWEPLPRLQFFQTGSHDRLRNREVDSGSRQLAVTDTKVIDGVRVLTPLRTAVDLARLRRERRALGAVDGLLRLEVFTVDDAVRELERFKGNRGIVRARVVVPLGDKRSESMAESAVRWDWRRAVDLPRPEPQLKIWTPFSSEPWRLDLAVEELKYAAEYDGADFHSSDEQRERDRFRRGYMREARGWTIDVLEKEHVYGPTANPMAIIRAGIREARLRQGEPAREWRWPSA